MINIDYSIDPDTEIMTIKVDLKGRYGPSRTGQTVVIASSEGNQTLWNGVKQRHEVFNLSLWIRPHHNTRGERSEGED
jgi:hypothetical protein